MNKYTFSEAVDISRAIFYDLNAKGLPFLFRSLPELKQMVFTATKKADLVKALFEKFEILEDSRRERYAQLVINYE